jgi:hypothetical protein
MAYTLLVVALFLYRHLAGGMLSLLFISFGVFVNGGRTSLHLRQALPEGLQRCILLTNSVVEGGDLGVPAAVVDGQDVL